MSEQREFKLAEDLEGPQREAATKPGNLVVAAGAGSGKTTVLAARYIRLLSTGRMKASCQRASASTPATSSCSPSRARPPPRCTPASTARWPQPQPAARTIRSSPEHLAACLADFSQAQISTFDSFAARVARSGSARFGIAPDFAVDEERAARMASDLALSFILEHREDGAMRELVASGSLEGVRDEVLAALAVRRMSISSPPEFRGLPRATRRSGSRRWRPNRRRRSSPCARPSSNTSAPDDADLEAWLDALAPSPEDEADSGFLRFLDRSARLRKPGSNSQRRGFHVPLGLRSRLSRRPPTAYRDIAATRAAHPDRLVLYRLLDEFRDAMGRGCGGWRRSSLSATSPSSPSTSSRPTTRSSTTTGPSTAT